MANCFSRRSFEDLVNVGSLGVIEAARHFDPAPLDPRRVEGRTVTVPA